MSTDQPSIPPQAQTSAIRHAATVVVTRPGAQGSAEIYMVRRSAKSPFMPSALVFPGGRLDHEDGPIDDDESWQRAARRECHEEAMLELRGELSWFDTWLTPSAEARRRYLTRFFLARLEEGAGREARADGFETHEGRWGSASAHLLQWSAQEVDLPPPTLCTLLRLEGLAFDDLQEIVPPDPQPTILPKVLGKNEELRILMPHDPDYDQAPGAALPAPARVQDLPRRFVRNDRVWTPQE